MKRNPGFSIAFAPEKGWTKDEISTVKKHRKISQLDLITLLLNVIKAEKTQIGFEDADKTYREVVGALGNAQAKVLVSESLIESALWSCNLLDEEGEFEHPLKQKFTPWMKQMLKPDGFDRLYNYIKEKRK